MGGFQPAESQALGSALLCEKQEPLQHKTPLLGREALSTKLKSGRGREGTTYIHHKSSDSACCLSSKLCMAQCPGRRWRGAGLGIQGAGWGASSWAPSSHCNEGFLLLPNPLFLIFICRPQAGASWWAPQAGFGVGRSPLFTMAPCSTFDRLCAAQGPFFSCSSSLWLYFFNNFSNCVIKNGHALPRLIKTMLLTVRRLALDLGKEVF